MRHQRACTVATGLLVVLAACDGSSPVAPDATAPPPTAPQSPPATDPGPAPAPDPQPAPSFGGEHFDARDYIEAIFLAAGPLIPDDVSGCEPVNGRVKGPRPDRTITVIIGSSVSHRHAEIIEDLAGQVRFLTAGSVSTVVERVAAPVPTPGQDQIAVSTVARPSEHGCPSGVGGCAKTSISSQGVYNWTHVFVQTGRTDQTYAHEFGHALGLCHVSGAAIGGADKSVMSTGSGVYRSLAASRLTRFDRQAMRAVYLAGIRPGDSRDDLLSAGLINH